MYQTVATIPYIQTNPKQPLKLITMQRSFSIVDDDFDDDESKIEELLNKSKLSDDHEDLSDPEEDNKSPRQIGPVLGPNGQERKITDPKLPDFKNKSPQVEKLSHLSSDSDDDTENDDKNREYNPEEYENLDIDPEAKEIFQYITKYIPQKLNLDYKFKPFIPDFLPSVGDIDAFLKVMPPELSINGEPFDSTQFKLGLEVLDEPAANQSDPALLHLQLRASSVKANDKHSNMITKKVANVEKHVKTIDKWIKDISDLHRSKSSPIVRYSDPMPDLDDLMQEWSEDKEATFQQDGFPQPDANMPISDYINTVCGYFNIPVNKSKVQSLHLLFSLYAAIKASQLYQAAKIEVKTEERKSDTDQLVLD